MISFREFLAQGLRDKTFGDTPEKDFAEDYARDKSTAGSDRHNDLELLLSHLLLSRACPEAIKVAKSLHRKWRKLSKPSKGGLVIGIDPGMSGSICITNGGDYAHFIEMPRAKDKDRQIDYVNIHGILGSIGMQFTPLPHVYLERAIPMAMGSKGAFNYGRGFEALVIALEFWKFPLTMVEPSKWTKEMHEGISADLKPKAKSLIAVNRLYPNLVPLLPKKPKGSLHDGPIDALLIAGYGLRKQGVGPEVIEDFF